MENSSSSDTGSMTEESLTPKQILYVVFSCVFCVVGVIGNGLVIYVTGFKMKTTVKSVWFLHLALADVLFILVSFIFDFVRLSVKRGWFFGHFMCNFHELVQTTSACASIFLLTAISLDRCFSVWVVVWAQNKRTPSKIRLICVFVWLLSLVCAVPIAMARNVVNKECVKTSDALTNIRHAWLQFVLGFVIPFIIITCCYLAIGVRANRNHRRRRTRPFLVILAVILTFFICWLPYHICNLILENQSYIQLVHPQLFNGDLNETARLAFDVAASLAFLNSCLNPFLYMFMCEEFQQKLKQSVILVLEHAFAE